MSENSGGPLGDGEISSPGEESDELERAMAEAARGQKPGAEELQKKNEQLRAMLDDSAARAAQTQERLKDTHERLLRTAAEFDNFRKRVQKEKDDLRKFAVESLLKDFLPVADNLERALDHAEEHDLRQVIEGVRLVQKMLADSLGKHGIVAFSAVGQPFDPNVHEALMQEDSDKPPGTVVSEMARGYKLHDRLVRPAAVVVARPRAATRPAQEAAASPTPAPSPKDEQ
ncbi:MAG: nucleotide exchange factor GrpE [Deltaproteobacteria bacterium]|nr:MAG: nucleotide exchange factor GrpE [Deltaproteobacteria bacterium]